MKKNIKWVFGSLILIIFVFALGIKIIFSKDNTEEVTSEEELIFKDEPSIKEEKENLVKEVSKVFVDIKGAILNPGVYEIEDDKKIIDVVSLAGGFQDNANTTTINLAKKVQNEMVIIVYTNEEINKAMEGGQTSKKIDNTCVCPVIKNDACINIDTKTIDDKDDSGSSLQEIININTATVSDFDKLPGIGASKAETIVQYREEHGNFNKIEDLKEISGIGEALFEKIKDYITV